MSEQDPSHPAQGLQRAYETHQAHADTQEDFLSQAAQVGVAHRLEQEDFLPRSDAEHEQ